MGGSGYFGDNYVSFGLENEFIVKGKYIIFGIGVNISKNKLIKSKEIGVESIGELDSFLMFCLGDDEDVCENVNEFG